MAGSRNERTKQSARPIQERRRKGGGEKGRSALSGSYEENSESAEGVGKRKKLIPVMIQKYCRGRHKTKGEVCEDCRALTEYALFRLEKCPFKVNKQFCSFCKIHCYRPDMRERIKEVMRWAGPRMIFSHPVFAFRHVFQMIAYRRKRKREAKAKENV